MNGQGSFDDQTLPLSVVPVPDRWFAFIHTALFRSKPHSKLSESIANETHRTRVYMVKAFGSGTQPAAVNGPALSSSMRLEEAAYAQRLAYDPTGGVPPVVRPLLQGGLSYVAGDTA